MSPKIIRIILILVLSACVSCASHRNLTEQTTVAKSESMAVSEDSVAKRVTHTDTTRTTHGKVIITEIEFDTTNPVDDGQTEKTPRDNARASPGPVVNINPDGGVSVSGGNVKNIRQTVIEEDTEQKGVADNESLTESHADTNSVKEELSQMERKEEETPRKPEKQSRQKWPWVLGGIALVALLYLKRIPVLNFIRKILGALRRIL